MVFAADEENSARTSRDVPGDGDSVLFRTPPLDGSLTLPELYDWHYDNNPSHPIFVYSDDANNTQSITWKEAVEAVFRAVNIVRSCTPALQARPLVIAILAQADSISYWTMMAGIIRAGYTCFPISPRNSPQAVTHLIREGGVTHIVVGTDEHSQKLNKQASALLRQEHPGDRLPHVFDMPAFSELYCQPESAIERPPLTAVDMDAPAVILHSSGSTRFPKPVPWTHRTISGHLRAPLYGDRIFCCKRISLHSLPMFHGMGFIKTAWAASIGYTVTTFSPLILTRPPDPETVLKGALDTRSDYIVCVPSFPEAWSRSTDTVQKLSKIKGIIYGGGPMNKEIGDYLRSQDVNYTSNTAACVPSTFLPSNTEDWEYFSVTSAMNHVFVPYDNNCSELIILSNGAISPHICNAMYKGVPAYSTSDLFTPHPTKHGLWRVYGRLDDQIMHSNGEKTNPGPLESILNVDPHIRSSVMFGRGRFHAGVIVDLKPGYILDPSNTDSLSQSRNLIWPTVDRMNEFAPQHSRIFKESMLVANAAKPFTYTAKNTVRRQAVLADYEDEIHAHYQLIDQSMQAGSRPPQIWDMQSTLTFVRSVVESVLKITVTDHDNIFLRGCDSLQATWIRNSLMHALRISPASKVKAISHNFMYQHSTVHLLANYLSTFATAGDGNASANGREGKLKEMLELALRYSSGLSEKRFDGVTSAQPDVLEPEVKDVVLIIGTTGSLGSAILAESLQSETVSQVYALNRAASSRGDQSLLERQRKAFQERDIPVDLLSSEKLHLVEHAPTGDDLGLPTAVIRDLHQSVTLVIHNAWKVDFNLSLASFEPNVAQLRSLIDLCLSSTNPRRPKLIFISSIGVARNMPLDTEVEEKPVEAEAAIGAGYSEAKWVGEAVLNAAIKEAGLDATIVRVGQICGGPNGVWNTTEWFPSIIKSGIAMGSLPDCDNVVTWVPSHIAATAIVDSRDASSPVIHLTHPQPMSWTTIIAAFASELGLVVIPYTQWLAILEQRADELGSGRSPEDLNSEITEVPALQLLEFFQTASIEMEEAESTRALKLEALGLPRLAIVNLLDASPTVRHAQCVGPENVQRWLAHWRSVRFLPSRARLAT